MQKRKSLMEALSQLFSLFILYSFTQVLELSTKCMITIFTERRQRYGCHLRLGAHFLSQDGMRTTKETETLMPG